MEVQKCKVISSHTTSNGYRPEVVQGGSLCHPSGQRHAGQYHYVQIFMLLLLGDSLFLFTVLDFILYSSFFLIFNWHFCHLCIFTPPSSSQRCTPDYFLLLVLISLHPHTNVVYLILSLRQHWEYVVFESYWTFVTLPTVKLSVSGFAPKALLLLFTLAWLDLLLDIIASLYPPCSWLVHTEFEQVLPLHTNSLHTREAE